MEAATKRLGWRLAVIVLVAIACAAAFAAYLRPGMLVVFGDIMTFCTALLR